MNWLKNIKEPISSAIGLSIIVLTIMSMYNARITWLFDGLIGVSIGTLFFMIPDKLVKLIYEVVKKVINKMLGNGTDSKS